MGLQARAAIIFGVTYVLVAGRRLQWLPIDRPAGALVGAVLVVLAGVLGPREAIAAIDLPTLILLFGVMGMGTFLSKDDFFERLAPHVARVARTRGRLLAMMVWIAGALSALVTNDAVCVLAAPVVVAWIRRWNLPRLPFLLALATAANTGSVATLVGNPQNMLCQSLGHLDFAKYLSHAGPIALVGLGINHAVIALRFRKELAAPIEERGPVLSDPDQAPADPGARAPLGRPALITLAVIAGSVAAYTAGANLAIAALAGFVVLVIVQRAEPSHVWERIDWSVLLFFAGLFVVTHGLHASGLPALVFERFPVHRGEGLGAWLESAGVFLLGSNVVTNVPFILVVKDEMAHFSGARGWELLAVASTFAGNLTLLGSVANVIVAEKARPIGGLHFVEYLKVGFPVAILTTLAGALWLALVAR